MHKNGQAHRFVGCALWTPAPFPPLQVFIYV